MFSAQDPKKELVRQIQESLQAATDVGEVPSTIKQIDDWFNDIKCRITDETRPIRIDDFRKQFQDMGRVTEALAMKLRQLHTKGNRIRTRADDQNPGDPGSGISAVLAKCKKLYEFVVSDILAESDWQSHAMEISLHCASSLCSSFSKSLDRALEQKEFKIDRSLERRDLLTFIKIVLECIDDGENVRNTLWEYCTTICHKIVSFVDEADSIGEDLNLDYNVMMTMPWSEAGQMVDCFVSHADGLRRDAALSNKLIQKECFCVSGVFAIDWPGKTFDFSDSLYMKIPIVIDEDLETKVFHVMANDGTDWRRIDACVCDGEPHYLLRRQYVAFESKKVTLFYAVSDHQEETVTAAAGESLHFSSSISQGLTLDMEPQDVEVAVTIKVISMGKENRKLMQNFKQGRTRSRRAKSWLRAISDGVRTSCDGLTSGTPTMNAVVNLPFNDTETGSTASFDMSSDEVVETVIAKVDDDIEILDSVETDGSYTLDLSSSSHRYHKLKVLQNWRKDNGLALKEELLRFLTKSTDCQIRLSFLANEAFNVFTIRVHIAQEVQTGSDKNVDSDVASGSENELYNTMATAILQERDQIIVKCGGMFSLQDAHAQTSIIFIRNGENKLEFTVQCDEQISGVISIEKGCRQCNKFEITRSALKLTDNVDDTGVPTGLWFPKGSSFASTVNLNKLASCLSDEQIEKLMKNLGFRAQEVKQFGSNRKALLKEWQHRTAPRDWDKNMERALQASNIIFQYQ
ncbi:hypothetical protein ScPMuIL_015486 [Solemya velum]